MEYHRGVVVEAARGLRFCLWRFVRGGVNGQRAKYFACSTAQATQVRQS